MMGVGATRAEVTSTTTCEPAGINTPVVMWMLPMIEPVAGAVPAQKTGLPLAFTPVCPGKTMEVAPTLKGKKRLALPTWVLSWKKIKQN